MSEAASCRRRVLYTDARRCLDLIPRRGSGRWLYACGLPDGTVKLGIAWMPRGRLMEHWRRHGGLSWAHSFWCLDYDSAERVERIAIEAMSALAERIGRSEYFKNASREAALAAVRFARAQHQAQLA